MQPFLPRILCADDDDSTTELMRYWLGWNGYEVKTVATVSEILRLARRESFDLFLLDDWFPDGRGLELIQELRDLEPEAPIVFLSGDVREARQAEILRLGAQAFLPKPADPELIASTIERLIHADEEPLVQTSMPGTR